MLLQEVRLTLVNSLSLSQVKKVRNPSNFNVQQQVSEWSCYFLYTQHCPTFFHLYPPSTLLVGVLHFLFHRLCLLPIPYITRQKFSVISENWIHCSRAPFPLFTSPIRTSPAPSLHPLEPLCFGASRLLLLFTLWTLCNTFLPHNLLSTIYVALSVLFLSSCLSSQTSLSPLYYYLFSSHESCIFPFAKPVGSIASLPSEPGPL